MSNLYSDENRAHALVLRKKIRHENVPKYGKFLVIEILLPNTEITRNFAFC